MYNFFERSTVGTAVFKRAGPSTGQLHIIICISCNFLINFFIIIVIVITLPIYSRENYWRRRRGGRM